MPCHRTGYETGTNKYLHLTSRHSNSTRSCLLRWEKVAFFYFSPFFLSPSESSLRSGVTKSALLPLPHYRALHFCREKISALPSLVDSHWVAPTHALLFLTGS